MSAKGQYDHGQLRGAYKAGYDAGFKAGRESLEAEGWVVPKTARDAPVGAIVKLMVKSMFGWKGVGRVVHSDDHGVTMQRCDRSSDDVFGQVDACLHEVMVKIEG